MTEPNDQDEKYDAASATLNTQESRVNKESPQLTEAEFQSYLPPMDQAAKRRFTREEAISRPFRPAASTYGEPFSKE